jgi:ribulose-phosphate 3-epimerase|tara:strand:- start:90 stop:677 length:588 start_codon:yes stop_codon:yes gene_type:complete
MFPTTLLTITALIATTSNAFVLRPSSSVSPIHTKLNVWGTEMNDYLIAPSILAADFASLGAEVDNMLEAGADVVHFDVMDNHFVPNLTIGPMVCKALRDHGGERAKRASLDEDEYSATSTTKLSRSIHFAPSSLGAVTAPIDVHLMVQPVDAIIGEFIKAGASYITFHPEASTHIDRSLSMIKEGGCKVSERSEP